MIIFISFILICMAVVTIFLLVKSPGRPKPFVDENGNILSGSLSEKCFVSINGVRQGMFIKSKNIANPVLLYLHGGMPEYFLTEDYPTGLEDFFTVVWWEQRGSGLSYSPGMNKTTISLEQMIDDTKEITKYLCRRFEKEKIYLMGHSGGTFIGIQTAAVAPELYLAYIGVSQMSNQLNSEILAYKYMLECFRKKGDRKMVTKLESSPVSIENGTPGSYLQIRDRAMHLLGIGTTRNMNSVITGVFFPSLVCEDYTLSEKMNIWRAKSGSGVSQLWDTMLSTDLINEVTRLDIPVYFFEGIYDYTCSYNLAKVYFVNIDAPVKGFYTFSNSAHSPLFEEPALAQQIIRQDVLNGTNDLADIK